ncbi:glycoside hydrolase family 92 protein, partial [bacterium]
MTLGVLALALVAPLSPVQEASPFVGTGGHGHTFPGATAPFGMVQLSPDTPMKESWDGCSGYHYSQNNILGFSHTHLSGTGVGGLGDIMVMPYRGKASEGADVSSTFSHDQESAQPGYYSVYLQTPKAKVELTATPRVGFHHYTFTGVGQDANYLVLDLNHGVQNQTIDTFLKVEDSTTLSGWRKSRGWGGERVVYFVMKLSQPMGSLIVPGEKKSVDGGFGGKVRAFIPVPKDVLTKVGISPTGIEGARKNLVKEAPGWDFGKVKAGTQKVWNDVLGATTIEAKDPKVRRTFYSNLYLSYQAPNLFSDVDGAYAGHDKKVHTGAKYQHYSTFSLWDTYRSLHPLLTLLQPDRVDDMMQSLVSQTEQGRAVAPVWPLWDNETYTMIGVHSVSVLAEAYLKGYRGFDYEKAYEQMKKAMLSNYRGLDSYNKLGWTASGRGQEATSKSIEYGYNDWCMAKWAEAMGKKDDADFFYKRSANYRNHWDGSTKLFRGRKADGSWRRPFDTLGLVGDEYTESDSYQYLFAAQHDIDSMIELNGGPEGLVKRLDGLLTMTSEIHTGIPDITGRIGQYAHGNEPCHHVLYLYNYASAPAKGAKVLRHIMSTMYDDTPEGQIGNVDCGQMSAWYVWSAMGVYP